MITFLFAIWRCTRLITVSHQLLSWSCRRPIHSSLSILPSIQTLKWCSPREVRFFRGSAPFCFRIFHLKILFYVGSFLKAWRVSRCAYRHTDLANDICRNRQNLIGLNGNIEMTYSVIILLPYTFPYKINSRGLWHPNNFSMPELQRLPFS